MIKKNREFRLVYNRGKSIANKHLVMFIFKNRREYNRLGISVSKKVGKAVVRNKIRRRLKESIRGTEISKKGYDIVLIARSPSAEADYKELSRSLSNLLKRI